MTKRQHDKNTCAIYRCDDCSILISTDAYVSHERKSRHYRSTFSLNIDEAEKLACEIFDLIDANQDARNG